MMNYKQSMEPDQDKGLPTHYKRIYLSLDCVIHDDDEKMFLAQHLDLLTKISIAQTSDGYTELILERL